MVQRGDWQRGWRIRSRQRLLRSRRQRCQVRGAAPRGAQGRAPARWAVEWVNAWPNNRKESTGATACVGGSLGSAQRDGEVVQTGISRAADDFVAQVDSGQVVAGPNQLSML